MRIFDLHCDTLSRCLDQKQELFKNDGQLDLSRDIRAERWVQTFACFVDSKYQKQEAWRRFLQQEALFEETLLKYPQKIHRYRSGETPKQDSCAAVLSVEGGHALSGNIENISKMKKMGVSLFTLVWNGDNELGSGALKGQKRGLTPFGKECVRTLAQNKIAIDISHLNDLGIDDVFSLTGLPVAATHSNLRSVCPHPRNLTEEQFSELVRRKGLCGLNFYPLFVSDDENQMEGLHRHLDRMLELGGEKTVALGSDFDGIPVYSCIRGVEDLYILYDAVVKWFGTEQADRIFYQNAADFYQQNLTV